VGGILSGMTAIQLVDTHRSKNPIVRFSAWYSKRTYGKLADPVRAFAHTPLLLAGYGGLELALQRSSRVPHRLKELGAIKAAAMAGCEWCMDIATMIGRDCGFTEKQLRALPGFRDSDLFVEDEKLVLEYAEALTRTPIALSDELLARMRERFDDGQIVEIATSISLENMRARFNSAVGLKPQGFAEGAICVRPEGHEATAA